MAAISDRFQGLRRPGASLLKKTLPSRPDEPVLARKAVPPPKVVDQPGTAANATSPTASAASTVSPVQVQAQSKPQIKTPLKGLPARPSPSNKAQSAPLPPTPSSSLSSSSLTPTASPSQVQPSQTQSQTQSQTSSQAIPPRNASLNDPHQQPTYQDLRPAQHRQVTNLQPRAYANSNLSPASAGTSNQRPVSEAPSLSQFIPDPEPEPLYPDEPDLILDNRLSESSSNSSNKTPSTNSSSGSGISPALKQFPDGYVPPIPEPQIIPPLTKVHYGCFQSHAFMPPTTNLWYATACMTCQKIDQEVRHRCTFCCMRICGGCFEELRKCKNRDLKELVSRVH